MVLQREIKVPVWGHADPNSEIIVKFAGQIKSAKADAKGAWRIELDPLRASSQNRVMTLTSGTDKLEIKDVLVGEVWICSGQSNMEWTLAKTPLKADAAKAQDQALRFRQAAKTPSTTPKDSVPSSPWLRAEGQPLQQFSAVAYAFGCQLRKELNVPVGLVGVYWGGTRIEAWTPLAAEPVVPSPLGAGHQQISALYHGMIHPWKGYAIRGALWYQGETNCSNMDGMAYADRMQAMVSGWRAAWGQGDFPFYFAQISPFSYSASFKKPAGTLPTFWNAQTKAANEIKNAGMAATQDVGNWKDIHPLDKLPVGERFARLALSRTYGKKFTDDTGPTFSAAKVNGDKMQITFDHAKSGLATRDRKPVSGVEIAGADGIFTAAEVKISNNSIIVWANTVKHPTQIRFGWHEGVDTNLMNRDKLPAIPFTATIE